MPNGTSLSPSAGASTVLWIKHLTAFARREFMVEIGHELGNEACYAVWLLLERVGEPWDGTHSPELCLPEREWRNITQLSEKKFQKLLSILQENAVIACSVDGKKMTLRADILLELQDESTRKRRKASGIAPEIDRTTSGPDTDKRQEKDKEQTTRNSLSAKMTWEASQFLRRAGIMPESPQGKGLLQYLEKQRPRNPLAYLRTILQNNPNFDPAQPADTPHTSPRLEGGLQQSGAILAHLRFPSQGSGP